MGRLVWSSYSIITGSWNSSTASSKINERNLCAVNPSPDIALRAVSYLGMVIGTTETPISPAPPNLLQPLPGLSALRHQAFLHLHKTSSPPCLCLDAHPFCIAGTISALRSQLMSPPQGGLPKQPFFSGFSVIIFFEDLFDSIRAGTQFETILWLSHFGI